MTRTVLAAAAVAAAVADPAAAQATLRQLLDERSIIAVADGLDTAVDAKNWDAAVAFFLPEIDVDLSAVGGPVTRMPAAELVGVWRANLFAEKTSFHLRGNHLVAFEGDGAVLRSKAYAWNRLPGLPGGELWEVWGDYTYRMARRGDGWAIASFTFAPTYQRGNGAVPGAPRQAAEPGSAN
jgi:ketosteroid isomerase-like protein